LSAQPKLPKDCLVTTILSKWHTIGVGSYTTKIENVASFVEGLVAKQLKTPSYPCNIFHAIVTTVPSIFFYKNLQFVLIFIWKRLRERITMFALKMMGIGTIGTGLKTLNLL
jgi:hypothetical protein